MILQPVRCTHYYVYISVLSLSSCSPSPSPRTVFFRRWFEVLDLVVIVLSTLLTIIFILLEDHTEVDESTGETVIS